MPRSLAPPRHAMRSGREKICSRAEAEETEEEGLGAKVNAWRWVSDVNPGVRVQRRSCEKERQGGSRVKLLDWRT